LQQLPKECRLYGCLLIRGKMETYGVHVDLGTTPRVYLTVEGKNRYYLGLKFIRGKWEGYVLLGVSHEGYADSEKELSGNLLVGQTFKKEEYAKAMDALLAEGNVWIENNDGGMDRSMWEFKEEQVMELKPQYEGDDDV